MKLIRIILFPIVPIYFLVTWLRNWFYDIGIKQSKTYDVPVICVGNLSTGGTGKTPMIEYLIRLCKEDKQIATLSRGYKRQSKGFVLADKNTAVSTLGDEPFQFFTKFKTIAVAVDENRQNGISRLLELENKPEVILLDDAYQHRKVKAGFSILLTAYNNLYSKDIVLPTGNLREPRSGANRANVVVVTKCRRDISDLEKANIVTGLNLQPSQKVFFSYIDYDASVLSLTDAITLKNLPKFTLVTGIANAQPLVRFLTSNDLEFDHLEYKDHHNFTATDIDKLENIGLIVTTEKDFVRLSNYKKLEANLYYLPIRLGLDKPDEFNRLVKDYID